MSTRREALEQAFEYARKAYDEDRAQIEKTFNKTWDLAQAEKLREVEAQAEKAKEEAEVVPQEEGKTPAICPVCGEPVENAFYDREGKLYTNPPYIIIVSEANLAYHINPGRDCWGKHTGYLHFKEASKP